MNKLIVIKASHYCEKARWALDRANVKYVEDVHLPVFHRIKSVRAGGKGSTPVLLTEDELLPESTDIVRYCDNFLPDEKKLFPVDSKFTEEINEFVHYLDKNLGTHIRRVIYYHVLPDKALTMSIFKYGAKSYQYFLFGLFYPVATSIMRKAMRINDEGYLKSLGILKEVFQKVEKTLTGDYLFGDRFTAADLTFGALAAPLLLPENHPAMKMDLQSLPDEVQDLVEEFRSSIPGQYGLSLYSSYR